MNCEQAQTILIDPGVDEKSTTWIQATDHISHCEECQVQAQFERNLGAWLEDPVQPKADLWTRIKTQTSDPALQLWMNSKHKKDKMKRNIITSSVAAATIMVGFALISQSALASTPKAKFVAMKMAVLSTVVKGDKAWTIRDGQLVEYAVQSPSHSGKPESVPGYILDSEPIKATAPGSKVVITPGVRAGSASESETSGDQPAVKDIKIVQGYQLKLDLNEAHYASIRFGHDQNELVLTQNGKSNTRFVVKLDHKTSAPTYLTLQMSEKGKWQVVQGRQVRFTVYLPLKGK